LRSHSAHRSLRLHARFALFSALQTPLTLRLEWTRSNRTVVRCFERS